MAFFYRWVMDKRMRYSQYTRGELPPTIKVKALKDKTFQWIKFLSIVVFYIIMFWQISSQIFLFTYRNYCFNIYYSAFWWGSCKKHR